MVCCPTCVTNRLLRVIRVGVCPKGLFLGCKRVNRVKAGPKCIDIWFHAYPGLRNKHILYVRVGLRYMDLWPCLGGRQRFVTLDASRCAYPRVGGPLEGQTLPGFLAPLGVKHNKERRMENLKVCQTRGSGGLG